MILTQPMLNVFAALLLAHMLGDFLFQPAWMAARKRNVFILLLHVAIHGVLTTLVLGGTWQLALLVMLAHLVIDAAKSYALPAPARNGFQAFLVDQALHIGTLGWIAFRYPGALNDAVAAQAIWLLPVALILSGAIAAVLAGGYAVGMLTSRFSEHLPRGGLPEAGRLIGQLERALIFLLILVDQPAAIGFLITAKSILRFKEATDDQKTAEYVIVGTLASFLWAMGCGYTTSALLEISAGIP
ncbi:hypothetical protein GGQ68_001452 [Sagittula marina]|uniref:DUF3307 domain-containing protein n=1 Tax=Sagittula marina TaxID=943940 RepID=A0A7W6DS80_9RHOB|nr:DUF3307 domain-containing protein [Sagittula marina]MBB3985123.1 hypothetical protein [Sagittula marina]